MQLSIILLAAISGITTALPTLELRGDERAATLFKHPDLAVVNSDSTFVPGSSYCTDISNIFGGFDGKIRSLSVESGFKCDFYKEAGCGVNELKSGGAVLEVGLKAKKDERKQLGDWDGKIASVYCQAL
ncbi:hypothetical protein EKO04_008620 [Ascochyta lentis]|uniref:Uncharacterized protein n=1 Tax=Ascochyta lentis TaxID=205686 RepID=A0A8H7IYT8_9PLEO|nr:hypothetical protein EKO04_008620 [Ascochyta lentis]